MKHLVHTPSLGAICLAGSEGIQYIPACQLGYCLWAFIQTFKEKKKSRNHTGNISSFIPWLPAGKKKKKIGLGDVLQLLCLVLTSV